MSTNPYDQFDDPSEPNPYDQFDEAPPTPVRPGGPPPLGRPAPKPAPREYGFFEAMGEGVKNAGSSAVKFGRTVKDAYLGLQDPKEMVPKAAAAAAGIPGGIAMLLGGAYLNLTPEQTRAKLLAASPKELEPMVNAANAVGGMYAKRYGSWNAIKRTMAEEPYAFSADLATLLTMPGVGTAARAAGQAAARVVPPSVTTAAKAARYVAVPTHAVNDLASSVANRAIPAAAGYAERVTNPTNALMMRAAEGRGGAIQNALAADPVARRIIPGSNPTAAQVVANPGRSLPGVPAPAPANAPRFAALGKAAEKRVPGAATDVKNTQNAARLMQIRQIGRTPADLDAATAAREANAARNYAAAGITSRNPATAAAHPPARVTVAADDAFHDFLDRPSMNQVMNRADQLARERGATFAFGTNARAAGTEPASYATYPADSLHDVKLAFDQLIANPERFGIGAAEVGAIRNTRNEFLNWFEAQNAPYQAARQGYGTDSVPINQMMIGQYLERKLQNPTLADDTASLRADAFSGAVQDAVTSNPIINKATGRQMYDNLDQILTPGQMQILSSVQDDMARAKLAEQQAASGARYGDDLNTAFSDAIGTDANRWWSRGPIAMVNNRIADDVANRMITPEGAAELMQNALARDAVLGRRRRIYDLGVQTNNFINPYKWMNQYPALYNALGAQEQQAPK